MSIVASGGLVGVDVFVGTTAIAGADVMVGWGDMLPALVAKRTVMPPISATTITTAAHIHPPHNTAFRGARVPVVASGAVLRADDVPPDAACLFDAPALARSAVSMTVDRSLGT